MRTFLRRRFPKAKWNVTVGRRWFWGGKTLEQLRERRTVVGTAKSRPDHGRRSGGDHLHDRQHRPAEGRAVHASHVRRPGERNPEFLRHPGRRNRFALLPHVRAVQLHDGRDDRHSRHGSHAARRGRSAKNPRSRRRLENHPGVRLAGGLESRRPILRRARHQAADAPPRAFGRRAGAFATFCAG